MSRLASIAESSLNGQDGIDQGDEACPVRNGECLTTHLADNRQSRLNVQRGILGIEARPRRYQRLCKSGDKSIANRIKALAIGFVHLCETCLKQADNRPFAKGSIDKYLRHHRYRAVVF